MCIVVLSNWLREPHALCRQVNVGHEDETELAQPPDKELLPADEELDEHRAHQLALTVRPYVLLQSVGTSWSPEACARRPFLKIWSARSRVGELTASQLCSRS